MVHLFLYVVLDGSCVGGHQPPIILLQIAIHQLICRTSILAIEFGWYWYGYDPNIRLVEVPAVFRW